MQPGSRQTEKKKKQKRHVNRDEDKDENENELENEEALTKKPMSTNVSLLRSLMGEVGYYRNIPPKMAAATKYTELTGCKKLSSHRNIRRTTVKPPGVGFS